MITTRLKNIYTCFPGGKHKVLTMSYDDGRTWDRKLVELFNSYKIKGLLPVCFRPWVFGIASGGIQCQFLGLL